MKKYQAFKYRLNPNKHQLALLAQHGGNTRYLWNYLLAKNIERYKKEKKFDFRFEMQKILPALKREEGTEFLSLSYASSLQGVAMTLDRALKDSFKKTGKSKGFPRFKKKNRLNDSFSFFRNFQFNNKKIKVPKIGWIKLRKSRPWKGKIKYITIKQDGEQWFASLCCEVEVKEKPFKTENIIGIDVGLKTFATCSDGFLVPNPRFYKKEEIRLGKAQRRASKKKKGSNNRRKAQLKVRRIHRKIRNRRQDFLHKTTSRMIAKYDGFVLEDLSPSNMMKNRRLAKAIGDASWSEFSRILKYKSQWNFKHFEKIGRFEPTTKKCSNCGHVQDMPLHVRTFNCDSCSLKLDRDLNASLNILHLGLKKIPQGLREFKPVEIPLSGPLVHQAQEGRYGSTKQEYPAFLNG